MFRLLLQLTRNLQKLPRHQELPAAGVRYAGVPRWRLRQGSDVLEFARKEGCLLKFETRAAVLDGSASGSKRTSLVSQTVAVLRASKPFCPNGARCLRAQSSSCVVSASLQWFEFRVQLFAVQRWKMKSRRTQPRKSRKMTWLGESEGRLGQSGVRAG